MPAIIIKVSASKVDPKEVTVAPETAVTLESENEEFEVKFLNGETPDADDPALDRRSAKKGDNKQKVKIKKTKKLKEGEKEHRYEYKVFVAGNEVDPAIIIK
jgi:hypothetical protein